MHESSQKSSTGSPASMCVGICSTLFDDVCRGCKRTAQEVDAWVFMTEQERAVVWQRLTKEPMK